MKKKASIFTLINVGLTALILLLSLFNVVNLENAILSLLWTTLTLTVCGLLTINLCIMLENKNKLAFISLSLLLISSFLAITCYWTELDNVDFFLKLTLILCSLSVCFNLISSSILKLDNNYKIIQIISYSFYVLTTIFAILLFVNIEIDIRLFITSIIFSFVVFCSLSVLSKKNIQEFPEKNVKYIMISKCEYDNLLACKLELEKLKGEKND